MAHVLVVVKETAQEDVLEDVPDAKDVLEDVKDLVQENAIQLVLGRAIRHVAEDVLAHVLEDAEDHASTHADQIVLKDVGQNVPDHAVVHALLDVQDLVINLALLVAHLLVQEIVQGNVTELIAFDNRKD